MSSPVPITADTPTATLSRFLRAHTALNEPEIGLLAAALHASLTAGEAHRAAVYARTDARIEATLTGLTELAERWAGQPGYALPLAELHAALLTAAPRELVTA